MPDACSLGLSKRIGAFTLGRGYLHVYVWQEPTVRLGLSLLSSGFVLYAILASSVPRFWIVSYGDVVSLVSLAVWAPIVLGACVYGGFGLI